ncbi:hypothetical protein [Niastella caeni]|nr:hypothetical protein [Niastella caeni]
MIKKRTEWLPVTGTLLPEKTQEHRQICLATGNRKLATLTYDH